MKSHFPLSTTLALLLCHDLASAQGVETIPEIEGTPDAWTWTLPPPMAKASNIQSVSRTGSDVVFKVVTNAPNKTVKQFNLGIGQMPVDSSVHNCRPKPGAGEVAISFKGEAFERIVPPTTEQPPLATPEDPVTPLRIQPMGSAYIFVGKFTAQQASGRFYLNGRVEQCITEFVAKMKKGAKTITWKPKAHAPYHSKFFGDVEPTSLPRFDVNQVYRAQVRVFQKQGEEKVHVAVVAIDTPGITVQDANRFYLGEKVETGDELALDASFATYFFEDCDAAGFALLPTHRIDWRISATFTAAAKFMQDSKGKSIRDSDTTIVKDPPVGTNSPWGQSSLNDPGSQGWEPKGAGSWEKTEN
ncbi:MAG: hypothetical protein HYY17_16840 [Planctomycetes bacterium]|nr:hypothetical protein [Planctomycetota bacterium]